MVGDSVYVAGYFKFFALDTADGRVRWHRRMNRWSQTPPAFGDGLLHYVNDGQYLRTLDAATGRRRWRTKYRRIEWNESAPVLADGTLYAIDDRGTVRAFDPASGRTRWQQSTSARQPSTPLVHNGCLYLAAGRGYHVYALDATTGARRWQAWPDIQSVSSIKTTPAIYRDTLYVGSRDHRLYALNATTGQTRWHVLTDGEVDSSPVVADGTVYFGTSDGHLWAVSAQNGHVHWKLPLGAKVETPVVANNILYVGTRAGYLYAIDATPTPGAD